MKVRIDYQKALSLINDEIAKEKPGHIYNPPSATAGCVNTEMNKKGELVGSCLVGRVLVAAGISADTLNLRASARDVTGTLAEFEYNELEITARAELLLELVQRKQDNGISWDSALVQSIGHVLQNEYDMGYEYNDELSA